MIQVGPLQKMRSELSEPVRYFLKTTNGEVCVNDWIGHEITLSFTGEINCTSCGKITKKAFGQGFCYPCFMNAPENSECIVRPELCEAHLGRGRDIDWEEQNHNIPHTVYLAQTSGIKVGVTRGGNEATRWVDQGAWKAIKLAEVPYRQLAGEIEVALKDYISDKTHWQNMLKDVRDETKDLLEEKEALLEYIPEDFHDFISDDDAVTEIVYPVQNYPEKVKSNNFDKTPKVSGVLVGVRGQYLIFDGGEVINLRKFTGYNITVELGKAELKEVQGTLF